MSQCGDYEDINFYVINVFYGIVIAVYFLPFKKITLYILAPINMIDNETLSIEFYDICLIIEQIVIKQEHRFHP